MYCYCSIVDYPSLCNIILPPCHTMLYENPFCRSHSYIQLRYNKSSKHQGFTNIQTVTVKQWAADCGRKTINLREDRATTVPAALGSNAIDRWRLCVAAADRLERRPSESRTLDNICAFLDYLKVNCVLCAVKIYPRSTENLPSRGTATQNWGTVKFLTE